MSGKGVQNFRRALADLPPAAAEQVRAQLVSKFIEQVQTAAVVRELARGGLDNPILDNVIARSVGIDPEKLTPDQRVAIADLALVLHPVAKKAVSDPLLAIVFHECVRFATWGLRRLRRKESPNP